MNDRCEEIREKIAEVLAGNALSTDRETVERHLLECPDCRQYQQGLVEDDQLLTAFVQSVESEVPRLEGRIMKSIDAAQAETKTLPAEGSWWGAWIFQSKIMKVAAAAVVITIIVVAVNLFDRTGDPNAVWARVMKQVEEAQDFICRVTQDQNVDADLDMVQYRSAEFGYRMDMYRRDIDKLVAVQYLRPSEKMLYTIIHRDKTYALMELTEEQIDKIMTQSNAKEMVRQFRSYDFEEIGKRKIDGMTASGIEVKNPEAFRGVFDESTVRLWVDIETNWPVRIECEGVAKGGDVRVRTVMDDFQWNPSLSAGDFEFEIPDDYTMIGQMGALKKDEAGAIEGLREYAGFSGGRYPGSLSMATAIHEVEDEIGKRRRRDSLSKEDFGNLMKIQNTCAFYVELLETDKDAAYYGDEVRPMDFDKVLMRWRIDGGRYRVVYGDLRTETVSAKRLAELEERD